MARRIAVLNQKGGVGKTTTAVNVAVALAQHGKRVLLLDLDAQRNATQFLGLDEAESRTGADALVLEGAFAPVRNVLVAGLDVVPATAQHALLERRLFGDAVSGPKKLKKALNAIQEPYDFVLTDCGPTLGMLALNAVAACPEVLIPIELAHAATVCHHRTLGPPQSPESPGTRDPPGDFRAVLRPSRQRRLRAGPLRSSVTAVGGMNWSSPMRAVDDSWSPAVASLTGTGAAPPNPCCSASRFAQEPALASIPS